MTSTTPAKKTMFNYFAKLPPKACAIEESSRKSAPIFNKQHVAEFQSRVEQFDSELANNKSVDVDYITSIKSGRHKAFQVNRKRKGSLRARLLQFSEDVRPPYFGTWQKKSFLVTGRRPFGQDNDIFDYEVDSEAEWDIGGAGESLKDDESEHEELDDYEIDMETFVPHGYVSNDEHSDASSEASSSSLQQNGGDNKQTPMDLKPIVIGLSFEDSPTVNESSLQFLKAFQSVSCVAQPSGKGSPIK